MKSTLQKSTSVLLLLLLMLAGSNKLFAQTITVSGSLAAFNTCTGAPSDTQSFVVSSANLTTGITVLAPTGFQLAYEPFGLYQGTLYFTVLGGNIPPSRVYVRLTSAASGNPSGNISLTSNGATTQNMAVTGSVNVIAAPTITSQSVFGATINDTAFNLDYSATTGSPNLYTLTYATPIPMAGFNSVFNQTLGASPIKVSIPLSSTNSYNYFLSVKNTTTGCSSDRYPLRLAVHTIPPAPQKMVSTVPPVDNSNGQQGVTFNIHAKDTVTITGISLSADLGTREGAQVWYKKSAIKGPPAFGTANGWILADSATTMIIDSPYAYPNLKPIPVNLSIEIPAGDTFGILVIFRLGSLRYKSYTVGSPANFGDSTITIRTGPTEGYGVAFPSSLFSTRQFPGSVSYIKGNLPPGIGNNTISATQSICSGSIAAPLTGSTPTGGSSYSYTWLQSTTSAISGFTPADGTNSGQNYTPATLTQTTWYKRLVSSGALSDTSTAIQITVNPIPSITLGSINSVLTTSSSFNLSYSATSGSPDQYSIITGTPTAMPSFSAINNATLSTSPIAITIPQSVANTYNFNFSVRNSSTGCVSANTPFNLTIENPSPSINLTGTLAAFVSCFGTSSAQQSFTASGSYLTGDITITPPTGFEVSTTSGSGYVSSLTLTHNNGTVSATTVYVRLTNAASGTPSGNIICTSTGASSKNIASSGTVNVLPSITLGTISSVLINSTSFNLPYTATAGSPNLFSISGGLPNLMPGFTNITNASLGSSPIAVTIPASAAGVYNFNISISNSTTGCESLTNPFSLTVNNPSPSINVTGSFDPISACSGIASSAQAFNVGGIYLKADVLVTAPAGFEVSNSASTGFGSTVSLKPVSGTLNSTQLWVRMSTNASGNPSGNISCTSIDASTQNLAVSGTIIPNPTKPAVTIQPSNPICVGAQYLNFGAANPPASGVTYKWSAVNALLYAQGSTKQYALISFPDTGSAVVKLIATENGCSSETKLELSVKGELAPKAKVRYFNNSFICEANQVNKYQWGFDEKPSLKGSVLSGEINQDYLNGAPDLSNKSYWVISSTGNCYQKSYYNMPSGIAGFSFEMNAIEIYPNPFTSEITLSSIYGLTGATVEVMDVNGKLLLTQKAPGNEFVLSLGDLAAGIYLVQIKTTEGYYSSSKVVKY
jgi:hypothetical protein